MLAVLGSQGTGQINRGANRLLASFDSKSDDVLNGIYNLGAILESTFVAQEETLAVRVCSTDPLPVALATAKGAPFLATINFEKLGIPKSQIYYLRQDRNCTFAVNDYVLTEYWVVYKGNELPEFIEALRATSLSGHELTRANFLLGEDRSEVRSPKIEKLNPASYSGVLDKVVNLMKEDRSALTVIAVPYYKYSPLIELNRRTREMQLFLKTNGVAGHRIFIKKIYSGQWLPSSKDSPQYPDITIVTKD
jgi:hypothetical protein